MKKIKAKYPTYTKEYQFFGDFTYGRDIQIYEDKSELFIKIRPDKSSKWSNREMNDFFFHLGNFMRGVHFVHFYYYDTGRIEKTLRRVDVGYDIIGLRVSKTEGRFLGMTAFKTIRV